MVKHTLKILKYFWQFCNLHERVNQDNTLDLACSHIQSKKQVTNEWGWVAGWKKLEKGG